MAISMTKTLALAQLKALGEGATFYASDLGICGGTMSGLSVSGYVKKTGNTRKVMVNLYDDIFKACEVYEWRVTERGAKGVWYLDKYIEEMFKVVDALRELGY